MCVSYVQTRQACDSLYRRQYYMYIQHVVVIIVADVVWAV